MYDQINQTHKNQITIYQLQMYVGHETRSSANDVRMGEKPMGSIKWHFSLNGVKCRNGRWIYNVNM